MKRFTDTCKWEKPWFHELPPHIKCLWLYICDKADAAGVWEANWKAASTFIGRQVSVLDLKYFAGRVATFGGKLVIGSFIGFQYGKLSKDCRAHFPIFRLIEKHSLSIGYSKAIHSLQEQEEEKEQEEEEDKGGGMQGGAAKPSKARGLREEVVAFCVSLCLPESDGNATFDKWEGNGWVNGTAKVKDWRATIRSWQTNGYMPSQKALKQPGRGNGASRGIEIEPHERPKHEVYE